MRAMTSPFLTCVLKSASSSTMRPDTWLPTCTVLRGDSVPLAVTVDVTRPRSTGCVLYSIFGASTAK